VEINQFRLPLWQSQCQSGNAAAAPGRPGPAKLNKIRVEIISRAMVEGPANLPGAPSDRRHFRHTRPGDVHI